MRSLRQLSRAFVALLCCLGVFALPTTVRAQDVQKSDCAGAYEKSQEQRTSGKLHAARASLVICANEVCPAFVQTDCAQWLTEVDREMPTVVIAAKGKDGSDTGDVKVFIDDQLVREQLDGKSVPVDPGQHQFRFEHGEEKAVERQILIRQGQKDRVIEVSFAPEVAAEAVANPYAKANADEPTADAEPAEEKEAGPGPLRPFVYIAGGVGVVGIIGWAVLGTLGNGEESDLRGSGCSPNCDQSKVDSIETKYLLADISLGVGILGLGGGVVLFFLSQPDSSAGASGDARGVAVDVQARRGGGFATVSGQF